MAKDYMGRGINPGDKVLVATSADRTGFRGIFEVIGTKPKMVQINDERFRHPVTIHGKHCFLTYEDPEDIAEQ